jgi:hypothetical protein
LPKKSIKNAKSFAVLDPFSFLVKRDIDSQGLIAAASGKNRRKMGD